MGNSCCTKRDSPTLNGSKKASIINDLQYESHKTQESKYLNRLETIPEETSDFSYHNSPMKMQRSYITVQYIYDNVISSDEINEINKAYINPVSKFAKFCATLYKMAIFNKFSEKTAFDPTIYISLIRGITSEKTDEQIWSILALKIISQNTQAKQDLLKITTFSEFIEKLGEINDNLKSEMGWIIYNLYLSTDLCMCTAEFKVDLLNLLSFSDFLDETINSSVKTHLLLSEDSLDNVLTNKQNSANEIAIFF